MIDSEYWRIQQSRERERESLSNEVKLLKEKTQMYEYTKSYSISDLSKWNSLLSTSGADVVDLKYSKCGGASEFPFCNTDAVVCKNLNLLTCHMQKMENTVCSRGQTLSQKLLCGQLKKCHNW